MDLGSRSPPVGRVAAKLESMRWRVPIVTLCIAAAIMTFFVITVKNPRFGNVVHPEPVGPRLPPPPHAHVEGELTHNFGMVAMDDAVELTHRFTIRNVDEQTFHIELEATTCDCVGGELPTDTLAPGESMDIDVTLKLIKPGETIQSVFLNANGAIIELQVAATGLAPAVDSE